MRLDGKVGVAVAWETAMVRLERAVGDTLPNWSLAVSCRNLGFSSGAVQTSEEISILSNF